MCNHGTPSRDAFQPVVEPGLPATAGAAAGVALLWLLACAPGTPETGDQSALVETAPLWPDTIDVILDDYVFGMPDSLPSGEITIRVTNVGLEEHDLMFTVSLGSPVAWRLPSRVAPGSESVHTLALEPGTYEVLCDFAGHIGRGMFATVKVVE